MTTITTGESGKAIVKDLPLGTYSVVETKAPEGFVLNPEPVTVALTYQDQDTPFVEVEAIVGNDRQKVSISVENRMQKMGRYYPGLCLESITRKISRQTGKFL